MGRWLPGLQFTCIQRWDDGYQVYNLHAYKDNYDDKISFVYSHVDMIEWGF